MKISGIAAAAVVAACLIGLGGNGWAQGSGTKADASVKIPHSQTVCPTDGEKINKAVHVDYQGKRIYFCCADCIAEFNKAPETYLKKMADQGVTPEKAPAVTEPKQPDEGSGSK